MLTSMLMLGAGLQAARAQQAPQLRIGMKAAVDSADPHLLYTPNRNVELHVYEPLMRQDRQMRPVPGLAESMRPTGPTTWEVTLRAGVRFTDGSALTPDDVVFSLARARAIEGARTYRVYVRDIAGVEVKDARTLLIRTRGPAPLLPVNMAAFGMVSARAAQDATEADFNAGRAAIGTGPYRWASFIPGAEVVLERNDAYWGPAEPWSRVTFRFVSNDSARTAALLAGDLDVIDTVPPSLYGRVQDGGSTQLVSATSSFTLYFQLDQKRERSPYVVGADGQPLPSNPLRDPRVRRAMSLALNRTAIAERAMEGGAEPAGQFMAPGFDGHDPALPPPPYDPPAARRLLAEAGFPQGFGLTVGCTNDRFAGDVRVCQTVAQMLTAVGIRTQVDAVPATVFFRRAGTATSDPDFSALMSIYSSLTGVGGETMTAVIRTFDAARGYGMANRGRHADPALDAALAASESVFDPAEREQAVWRATEIAMADTAVIPVFFMKGSWGLRRGLSMQPRGDQYTYATDIRPAP